jgi:hypothetical protein
MFYRVAAYLGLMFIAMACGNNTPQNTTLAVDENDTLVTFNRHIAPIIHQNCAPCHRPGEAGPFSLLTYTDVRKRTKMIDYVTSSGFMPPWPADTTYSRFANERRLSLEQINLIQTWIAQGASEGSGSIRIPENLNAEHGGIGKPDMVVRMLEPMHIKGNNTDHFRLIKIPFELKRDTFLRAIEFVPGNRQLVHHMNGNLINYQEGKKTNIMAGATIVNPDTTQTMGAYHYMQLANDDGTFPALTPSVVNYLPGVMPAIYPAGIGGYKISKKGAFLIQNMHYGPSAADTFDVSHINLYFSPIAPKRPMLEIQMGTLGETLVVPEFIIPANEVVTFTTTYRVPQDISVLTINPHMHLLGTEFEAFAILPDGDTIPLVRINKWDFRWQYFYTFKNMLKIPKGSIIKAIGTFDNTIANPHQPFMPPRTITEPAGDMKTTDEMFQFFINYVPYQRGDENISLEKQRL